MQQNNSVRRAAMFGAFIGVSLGLFRFWQFTLIFFILGGIATALISVMTGYMVNFLLVLVVEYLLMVLIMFIAMYVHRRRFDKR